jgi:hypothetical protein
MLTSRRARRSSTSFGREKGRGGSVQAKRRVRRAVLVLVRVVVFVFVLVLAVMRRR